MPETTEAATSIYDLGLHERKQVDASVFARRVPGGWIYENHDCRREIREGILHEEWYVSAATFVPYNSDCKPDTSDPNLPF